MGSKSIKLSIFLAIIPLAMAQRAGRYALILEDDPVAARFSGRAQLISPAAASYRTQIEARHASLRAELASRDFRITGAAMTTLNAVFVVASPSRVAELKGLNGVREVVPLRRYKKSLNRALTLLDAQAGWTAVGGLSNAGAGIKIGFIDTGVDQTHAAFQDSALTMPTGFPKCTPGDCAFTNSKVIVARSYVPMLAAGSDPKNPAADSRPDDLTARDHDGHGTSTAATATANITTGLVTFNGMAPKAQVGAYKIFGSPGVNDETYDDVIIQALEDAIADGMDVVSASIGQPAFTGPLDMGAVCGQAAGTPCNPVAAAFENATKSGTIVVVSAGNDGFNGQLYPAFNTIESPSDAPDAISVGGTSNSHFFSETVSLPGNVPSNLQHIPGKTGTANTFYPGAKTLPLLDVTQIGDDGTACNANTLPGNLLYGLFVLVRRGGCDYETKVINAENAGAFGVIIYMDTSGQAISPNDFFDDPFLIPFIVITNSNGVALKTYVDSNVLALCTIDSAGSEQVDNADANQLVGFSSIGPSTGDSAIKPDLVATGENVYTAAGTYDPNGEVYSSTGFVAAAGTSYSAPLVAGAAAIVKQKHPGWTPLQIKSALVNNVSTSAVQIDDASSGVNLPVDIQSFGAGLLDVGAAAAATVTANPVSLSFGILSSLPQSKAIQLTNNGSSAVTLAVSTQESNGALGGANVTFDKSSVSMAPGATATVNVTLSGTMPTANEYSAYVTFQGNNVNLSVPYMYIVPDNNPGNLIAMGFDFDGVVGQSQDPSTLAVKLTDDFGAPIANSPVKFTAPDGGKIMNADTVTNAYGIAQATAVLGARAGNFYTYAVDASNFLEIDYSGFARLQPTITGFQNAASFDKTSAVAPGSYLSILGAGLCDFTDQAVTARLPLAIGGTFVSFDVPSAGISVPGHLSYVSPTQINVQVPWELAGQTSAQMKVTIDFSYGNVFTLPLAAYSPAFFEIGTGKVAARDSSFNVITPQNPAKRGTIISLYANGLGPLGTAQQSGEPASTTTTIHTTTLPVVMFGTTQADVGFAGLTPGIAGLYQINVTVPNSLAPGTYPLTMTIGGVTSKASGIAVQ